MKPTRAIKRTVVAVIGGTVILFGTALLVLPGPGLAVIAVGVGILATEFVWAKCLFAKAKVTAQDAADHLKHLDGFGKSDEEKQQTKEELDRRKEERHRKVPPCRPADSPADSRQS